ncbi:FCD domain-containing protein [Thalassobaculum sp.]|uniref:FadR/GntR family transcriptional regulator n=1 Tax=Thalassobaculum sp. TaxID=2022740 RepID=UPI0032EC1B18
MSDPESADRRPLGALPRRRRQDSIGEQIKDLIIEQGLRPGERLPGESALMARFGASKGSIREALSALRSEGIIRTRTGPGGGVFLSEIGTGRAIAHLSNYFLFRTPSVTDIYDVRCELEPELAASVAGRLSEVDFARLERTMRLYDAPPATAEEEYQQRMAELDFHSVLAELCPNPVLGLFCGFLQTLLREMAVCRRIYDAPHPELRDTALHYQIHLMRALRASDAGAARTVMAEHMIAARDYMVRMEASIAGRFLRADAKRD